MKITMLENDNNYTEVRINDHILLFSYCSLVASRPIDGNTLIVYPKYNYSLTTSKHLKKFTGYTSKEIKKGKNLPFGVLFAKDDKNLELYME
jgi:hypothetical protein